MSYLNKMYGKHKTPLKSEKNPARVAGGMRAQGVDRYNILDENGSIAEIPSHRYVSSLEEQLRNLKNNNAMLEKKTSRLDMQVNNLETIVKNLLNRNP